MQTNILWTGREYYSLENCLVNTTDTGSEINSVIIGKYNDSIYHVEYLIRTNPDWETVFVELRSRNNDHTMHVRYESDGKGSWFSDGKEAEQFKGCMDIDIPLTPFTNTLPVNRLKLTRNQEQQIRVIYIDILVKSIKPVSQKYTRLSDTSYQYENVPNDFEATIRVDESGFVVDYPSLFERTAVIKS